MANRGKGRAPRVGYTRSGHSTGTPGERRQRGGSGFKLSATDPNRSRKGRRKARS